MRLVANFLGEEVEVGVEISRGYTLGQLFSDVCASVIGLNMGEVSDFCNLVGIYGLLPPDERKTPLTSQSDLDKLMEMYSSLGKHNHEAEEVQVAMTNLDDEFLSSEDEPEIDMGMQLDAEDIDFDDLVVVDSEDGDECSHDYEQLVDSEDEIEPVMARVSDKMAGSLFKRNDVDLIEFEVGQIFNDVQYFKDTLADYKVQEGFQMKRMHNTKKKQTACCKAEGCNWRIHASTWIDGTTFKVKTYSGPHTCKMTEKSKGASSSSIAQKYEKAFKTYQSNLTIDDLNASLVQDYGVHVSATKLYRARKKALENIDGDFANSYSKLPKYAQALRDTNNGVYCKLLCDGLDICNPTCNPILKRFFVSFSAQRQEFKNGCRPFIAVDGCFLKGPFKGELFTTVTLDANSTIFPIAIMVAEGESGDSWEYFLDCLKDHLGDNRSITFMSDRQKGLINAVSKKWPEAKHRYCAWHRYNNFKVLYPGPKFKALYWAAVKAFNEDDFKNVMVEMIHESEKAWEWMMSEELFHWSREWQISGVPWKHAMSCIHHIREELTDFIHSYLTKKAYLDTYSGMISPIPQESRWREVENIDNHPIIQPPKLKILRGRPKLQRRRGAGEPVHVRIDKRSIHHTCQLCKEIGHNKKTCQENPANWSKKRRSKNNSSVHVGKGKQKP
ncbi:UNVERIFIED_CONTAM: hypothetical protein Slati_0025200 [Sesamum latifolium]|uniref:Mutator-like transposase n=1 Tax=Sesamum latifolium TaxID=2727402 RepID=A0AAW2Y6Z0_9LAMI